MKTKMSVSCNRIQGDLNFKIKFRDFTAEIKTSEKDWLQCQYSVLSPSTRLRRESETGKRAEHSVARPQPMGRHAFQICATGWVHCQFTLDSA